MKIELKLGNSAGIVYGNCPAVFSRLGVKRVKHLVMLAVCDIALWWSSRTNQGTWYTLVFMRKKRFRDTLLANCWIVKRMQKNWKFPLDQVLRLRAGVIEMIAFETRATSFRNVIRANTNITSSIFHGKSGIWPVTLQIKRNFSVKIRNKSRIIFVYGVNKWCKVSE